MERRRGIVFPLQSPVPWSRYGHYLAERPFFTIEPWLHAGAFYVQEASSMFLEQAVRQCLPADRPLRVLDGCAAPGGKSTHLLSLLPAGSVLVSNEVIKARVSVLEENLLKWGSAGSIVTSSDPSAFSRLNAVFDALVVDAPCSGSGLFRRDAAAVAEWSAGLVTLCSQRQQRILADYLPCLKPGGVLVYSTCSYSVEEDEAIADWLLNSFDLEPLVLQTEKDWNIVESVSAKGARGYRFYPDKLRGEGFFLAAFRKKEEAAHHGKSSFAKQKYEPVPKKQQAALIPWLAAADGFSFYQLPGAIHAFTNGVEQTLLLLPGIYVKNAGIAMGKLAGERLVPDHALALSQQLNPNLPAVSLNREAALRYLRKEDLNPPAGFKGWALVNHAGLPLGWIKLLGNRANNYYPAAWRILKTAGHR
ncbi:MAG: hypothetical protein QM664_13115 [Flavihumibacter sp.]